MLPRSALTLACALLVGAPAAAQTISEQPDSVAPSHVSFVEGGVSLEREGRLENAPLNMPLLAGDRLKTLDGRAEVLFADGSALHLDARSIVDVQSDELLRLIDGRLRLNIPGEPANARRVSYRIDSPSGSVRILSPGEYRVALLRRQDETQLELAVLRGTGEIFTDEGTTAVRAGERAYASAGLMPSYTYAYNSATWDAFDRWSEARRDTRLGVSSQYLPEDVRSYASTFDEYGDWRYQASYGYVWYPRVAASWRPYYYGRWVSYPRYGWTWVGADGFAWPTHHYGRWGFSAGLWFWIPSSRWAPAYVSWAYAPGYVSWCPLGFDNRPVISVNVFNVGPGYYASSRAWTAVSYAHFGRDYYVPQRAVNWDRWDRRTPFQAGHASPNARDVAVGRAPIRWAGSRAGGAQPSDSSRYINRGDEIVRSATERPTPPSARGSAMTPARERVNGGRAVPQGPAQRADVAPNPSARDTQPAAGYARTPIDRSGSYGRALPRDTATSQPSASPSRDRDPRGEAPAYQPRYGDPYIRTRAPRGDDPAYAPRGNDSTSAPRAADPAPAPAAAEPRSRSYDPGSMPRRGGYEPRPAAPSTERQAPPPQRAAPPPAPSRGGNNAGSERAVPRSGGTPARRGGGRGGA